MLFVSCVCHAFASVRCCLLVACWVGCGGLLALVCDVGDFVAFPCYVLGRTWNLIVLIPDHCRLSYFV